MSRMGSIRGECVGVGVVGGDGLHFVAERHIPQSRKIRTKHGTVRSYMEKGLGMAQRTRLTYEHKLVGSEALAFASEALDFG